MSIIHWSEIEGFHNVRKHLVAFPETINYRAKVKLHGTNAAIQCHKDGTVIPQSRTTELSDKNDNMGFAKWVFTHKDKWNLKNDLVIFGEWCGKGIMKEVAISAIPQKIFAVFAARSLSDPEKLIIEPEELQKVVAGIPDTYVLPWWAPKGTTEYATFIRFNKTDEELKSKADELNLHVLEVEENDPWVDATFGVKGIGEGLVFYPISSNHLGVTNFSTFAFKAKGEKHRVTKAASPIQIKVEVIEGINQFLDTFVTEPRLEQGLNTVAPDGILSNKLIGSFIKWVTEDVEKESKDELAVSGLDWKQLQKPVSDKARTWFLNRLKNI